MYCFFHSSARTLHHRAIFINLTVFFIVAGCWKSSIYWLGFRCCYDMSFCHVETLSCWGLVTKMAVAQKMENKFYASGVRGRKKKKTEKREIQGARDLWSLEVQRDLIKWAKECEDRAHKKRAGDREDWKRERSQIEDRLVCRKRRAVRWEGKGAERKERGQKCKKRVKELERERERNRGGSVKRSWSGYETNSDLIWRVYDCVFLFFAGTEMQAGIRQGGALGWAQREETHREMWAYVLSFLLRYSTVYLCVTAGWGGREVSVGYKQIHSDAASNTWAWITEVL